MGWMVEAANTLVYTNRSRQLCHKGGVNIYGGGRQLKNLAGVKMGTRKIKGTTLFKMQLDVDRSTT